jgi:hypothetical protein
MSLNQIYYDPTITFNVSSQSNIKANLFRCKNGRFDNVDTTTINGLPINGGNLPFLQPGDNFKILTSNAINQVEWSEDLVIRSDGSLNFDINSKLDIDKTTVDIYNKSVVNIIDSEINTSNNTIFNPINSRFDLTTTPINMVDSNLTITSSTNQLNYGIITPKISFAKSGALDNSSIDFYQYIDIEYRVLFQEKDTANIIDTMERILVTFCRIGKLVNVSFNNFKPFKLDEILAPVVGFIELRPGGVPFNYLKPSKPVFNLIGTYNTGDLLIYETGYYVVTTDLSILIYKSISADIPPGSDSNYFTVGSAQADIGLTTINQTNLFQEVNFHFSYYALDV